MDFFNLIKIIAAAIFILFLPGLNLSFVFFGAKKIDLMERLTLSFALSISVVPLVAFYINLIGVPIRSGSVIIEVLLIHALSLLVLVIQRKVPRIEG